MAASGALQALLDQYSKWTPGSGVKQLPAWHPDNLNDPSAAMFGFGAPHVYWQALPAPTATQRTILPPPKGGQSGDQGSPGGGLTALQDGSGNYAGPTATSGGIPGAGGLGNGYGLGNGFGSVGGSAPGSFGGFDGGSPDYEGSTSYLDGLAAANGLGDQSGSSWSMPSGSTIGSILGGLIAGPIGAVGGSLVGSVVGPSKTGQALESTMNQGAMGVGIPSSSGGTPFTPDGSDPGGGHAVDSTGFVDGAGQNSSYSDYGTPASTGGGGGSGWSEGGGHDYGGGQYGQVVDVSGGGMAIYHHTNNSFAVGGSVGGRAFGKFMSGPMQSDPRTAEFAAQLKQAMTELATGLHDDPQAGKVRAFFQANYVEPVEDALRKKDAEGAMRLCVAMMNEAHRIAQGERP